MGIYGLGFNDLLFVKLKAYNFFGKEIAPFVNEVKEEEYEI